MALMRRDGLLSALLGLLRGFLRRLADLAVGRGQLLGDFLGRLLGEIEVL